MITSYQDWEEEQTARDAEEAVNTLVSPTVSDTVTMMQLMKEDTG
jgi:hypothetical protein